MEFVLSGVAACGAGLITNPLDVVKTRLQLQGELQARGKYTVHYKNVFHGAYVVAKVEGLRGIQKGLVPALFYQFAMNGVRLGVYQVAGNMGLTKNANGEVSAVKSVFVGAFCGVSGSLCASPFFMAKVQLQSAAASEVAVGKQHGHKGMLDCLTTTFKKGGLQGLWVGGTSNIPRTAVGSAAQLTTFSTAKEFMENLNIFPEGGWANALCASFLGGIAVAVFMTPLDVVATRLYNQGLTSGSTRMYKGVGDCLVKVMRTEGPLAFYKGVTAQYLRVGPHSLLNLTFWSQLMEAYYKMYPRTP